MFFQVSIKCLDDKNIDFKELRQVKNQNTTIGEFISALLTEREVDDVRIEEIIKSSETNNQTTAVRVASETPCILIHNTFAHRYIFVTVTILCMPHGEATISTPKSAFNVLMKANKVYDQLPDPK
jgi:hypothetical protein